MIFTKRRKSKPNKPRRRLSTIPASCQYCDAPPMVLVFWDEFDSEYMCLKHAEFAKQGLVELDALSTGVEL